MSLAWKIGLGVLGGGAVVYVLKKSGVGAKIPGIGGAFQTPAKTTPAAPNYNASNPSTTGTVVAIGTSVLQAAPGVITAIGNLFHSPAVSTTSPVSTPGSGFGFTTGDTAPPPYLAAASDTSSDDSYNPFSW